MPSRLTRCSRGFVAVALALVGSAFIAAHPARADAPDDPLFPQQWALGVIGAPQAWSVSTGAGVTIGIVDTGIDLGHEDLASKVAASTDCIGSNGDARACRGDGQDDNGHGTHVSGIAAAATNNGRGIAGVAPDARLLVAKVLDANGSGSGADVAGGIHWVVDHGAQVVNLSLGDIVPVSVLTAPAFTEAVEYAWSHGAVPVLAAGNDTAVSSENYGSLDAVVVSATARDDSQPYYSSSLGNAKWGIAAPGGEGNPLGGDATTDILSTWWASGGSNQYAADAGTSMAAPHVSGALALLLAEGLSPSAAVQRILDTADPIACGTNCHGRLDAARAVGSAPAPSQPPTTTAAAPSGQPQAAPTTLAPSAQPGPSDATGQVELGSNSNEDANSTPTPAGASGDDGNGGTVGTGYGGSGNSRAVLPASSSAAGSSSATATGRHTTPSPTAATPGGRRAAGAPLGVHPPRSRHSSAGLLTAVVLVAAAAAISLAVAVRRRLRGETR